MQGEDMTCLKPFLSTRSSSRYAALLLGLWPSYVTFSDMGVRALREAGEPLAVKERFQEFNQLDFTQPQ